jgi:GT2 family glycosyltransferase
MCVRGDIIRRLMFDEDRAPVNADTSVSGRGDESNLGLYLSAAGYEQRIVREAVVLHDHRYSGRQLFRQAYRSGGAHARLAYKYRRRPPLELVPLFGAYACMPLAIIHGAMWWVSLLCAIIFMGGIYHSERSRKNKTLGEAIRAYPIVLAYYHVRLIGFLVQQLRLWMGIDRIDRVSPSRHRHPD